ncbi:MAG: hypothetical protein ACYDBB_15185 [Armatimonadota bacterium]
MRWIVLLILSLCCLPLWAQAPAVTDDLINRADLIMRATVFKVTAVDGGTNYQMGLSLHGNYKGSEDLATWPMFVPAAQQRTFNVRDTQVFFLKVNEAGHRTILLDDAAAVQPGDMKSSQALVERIQAMSGIAVTMDTTQPTYGTGDTVVLRWTITNNGNTPVSVYIGQYAFLHEYILNNAKHSTGSGGTHSRKAEDYKLLAPGGKYVHLVELRESLNPRPSIIFPVGTLAIKMQYNNNDNWLGTSYTPTGRVENVAFLHKEASLQVTITPPSSEKMVELRKQLTSPIWHEQLVALRGLSGVPEAAVFPEVLVLADHPWQEIRKQAAVLLSLAPGPLSPEMRRLIADPSFSVRNEACQLARRRQTPNASLTFYAFKIFSEDAYQQGYVPDQSHEISGVEVTLNNSPDPRLGDIMATRVKEGTDNGYLLNRILPREQRAKVKDLTIAEEDKAGVLAYWEKMRGTVKDLYTMDQFTTELAFFHTRIIGDYTLEPRMKEVRGLLHQAGNNLATNQDTSVAALEAYGPKIAPTMLYVLNNAYRNEYDSYALYHTLMKWQVKEAAPLCLGRALNGSIYAALAAYALDPKLADAQLKDRMADNNGVAVVQANLGNTKAVPYIMEKLGLYNSKWAIEQTTALTKITGKSMIIPEWKKWWETEGKAKAW